MNRILLCSAALVFASCLNFEGAEQKYCEANPSVCGSAQMSDAGGTDSGTSDAGGVDSGVDAGIDAGTDGGSDAGTDDAGTDAGSDAGVDAGIDASVPIPDVWGSPIGVLGSAPDVQLMSVDPASGGGAWVSGTFAGGLMVNGSTATPLVSTPSTASDPYFIRYGASGRAERLVKLGSPFNRPPIYGRFAVEDSSGHLWLAVDGLKTRMEFVLDGGYDGGFDAGFDPILSLNGYGAALARYAPDGTLDWFFGAASNNNAEISFRALRPFANGGGSLAGYTNGQSNFPACQASNPSRGNAFFLARITNTGTCGNLLVMDCGASLLQYFDHTVVPSSQDVLVTLLTNTASTTGCSIYGVSGSSFTPPLNTPALVLSPSNAGLNPSVAYLTELSGLTRPIFLASRDDRAWMAGTFSGPRSFAGTVLDAGASDVFVVEISTALGQLMPSSAHALGGPGVDELLGLSAGRDGGLDLVFKTAGGYPVGAGSIPALTDGGAFTAFVTYDPDAMTFSAPYTIAPFSGVTQVARGNAQSDVFIAGLFDGGIALTPDASVAVTPYSASTRPSVFVGKISR